MKGEKTKVIFLHIPKATGTSARIFFMDLFGKDNVSWLGVDFSMEELLEGSASLLSNKVVGGHFSYSLSKSIPGYNNLYVSVVREPISRVISLYRYIQRIESHHLHEEAQSKTMLEMIETCAEFRNHVSNFQVQYISDISSIRSKEATFMHAVKNIESSLFYLSSLRNVTGLFQILQKRLAPGTEELVYGSHNISPNPIEKDNLWNDKELMKKLKELNKEDIEFYKWVDRKGVIVPTAYPIRVVRSLFKRLGAR